MKNIKIKINKKSLDLILNQVAKFDWSKIPEINNWSLGVNKKELKVFCDYWLSSYDWKKEENKINRLDHYEAIVNDLKNNLDRQLHNFKY